MPLKLDAHKIRKILLKFDIEELSLILDNEKLIIKWSFNQHVEKKRMIWSPWRLGHMREVQEQKKGRWIILNLLI